MSHHLSLKPEISWSSAPKDYFNDVDYTDYRELVCFERPACFILHYYFGLRTLRNWLYDRFAFESRNGVLVHRSNALADYLKSSGAVSEIQYCPGSETLGELLSSTIGDRSALVLPIETRFGDSVSVTAVLVEGYDASAQRILYTCLRGDDFFVRREADVSVIDGRLSVSQEGTVECHRIRVTEELLLQREQSHADSWQIHGLEQQLRQVAQRHYGKGKTEPLGSQVLLSHLESVIQPCEHYARLVGQGFTNVLLAQIFWPMLFAYSPFVVFLRNARRNCLRGEGVIWEDGEAMDRALQAMFDQSQVVTNLGLMFGRSPKPRELERFLGSLRKLCKIYGDVEAQFTRAVSRKEVT